MYLLILPKLYHIWRFCIILDDCIIVFLQILLSNLDFSISFLYLWIFLSNHSCLYDNRCKFHICSWCRKFNVPSKYIHFYTSISYIWKVMNRYVDLGKSSYKYNKFNLAAKGLIRIVERFSHDKIVNIMACWLNSAQKVGFICSLKALWKWWKMLFLSSKKLFSFLRCLNFCPDFYGHEIKRLDKKAKLS